jgi:predicted nucleotidyltransferase
MLPRTVARVNSVLMLHADGPLAIAEIARAAGVPYVVAQSAIRTMERRGMVVRRSRAGRDEFGPDTTSPYYPMAHAVALVDLPIDGALKGHHVAAVFAYGSLAVPGGGTRKSDIDLLVVGDVLDAAGLRAALAGVGMRYGRAVDLLIITPEGLDHARATEDPHVASALAGVRLRGALG